MKKRRLNDYPDPSDTSTNSVVSSTECTGLMHGLPNEKEDVESYSEIYEIPDQGSEVEFKKEYDKETKK